LRPASTPPAFSSEPTSFITPGTARVSNHAEDSILEFQKKSATSGFSESQYALGMRYLVGDGVPKDEAKAKELIKQASNGSSTKARAKMWEFEETDRQAKQAAKKAVEETPSVRK
jgi:TPR repeat protein